MANEKLVSQLRSPALQQQLRQLLDKHKEQELVQLFQNYYGQSSRGAGGRSGGKGGGIPSSSQANSAMCDLVLDSTEFRDFILELLHTVNDEDGDGQSSGQQDQQADHK